MISTDINKINDILERGTEDVFVKESLKERLLSGQQLRIKLGIDPTSPFIHLGRAVTLRKLKAFQDLGHHIVLIIGDYTAKIGDPSDKLEKRPTLSDEEIKSNLENYLEQIALVIDMEKVEVRYNSTWLKSMSIFETAKLLECFTVQQMSKRRNFKERLDAGNDVFMIEFIYPALQGYDSVVVKADVEIGGFDQLFNLKAGRVVQRKYGETEQDIMTLSMLEGIDGRKMSSSWGNIISIVDTPEDMFGKVMALKDELIIKYFTLCTEISMDEIHTIEEKLNGGENPKNIKLELAGEIVTIYHGEEKAKQAQETWTKTFSEKEIPTDIPVFESKGESLMDIVVVNAIVESKGDFRRLVEQGAIEHMESKEIVSDANSLAKEGTYRIGKKRFVRIM